MKGNRGDIWLFAAEGEGRNAVYAAKYGLKVKAFDMSHAGQKKALALASRKGVAIDYEVAKAEEISLPVNSFDGVVLIYAHFPSEIRKAVHAKIIQSLKPGGIIIFEAFSKKQIEYQKTQKSGGPQDSRMLFDVSEVRNEFPGIDFKILEEKEITLNEGAHHKGKGHVVRFVGIKHI